MLQSPKHDYGLFLLSEKYVLYPDQNNNAASVLASHSVATNEGVQSCNGTYQQPIVIHQERSSTLLVCTIYLQKQRNQTSHHQLVPQYKMVRDQLKCAFAQDSKRARK